MDAGRRSQYLATLGIDVWVPRHGAPPPEIAFEPGHEAVVDAGPAVPVVGGMSLAAQGARPANEAPPSHARPVGPAADVGRGAPLLARGVGIPAPPLSADAEGQWTSLSSEIMSCTRCPLHATRTQGVVGVGYRQADWLVIGEAPGAEEDRRGEPFVGRAGQLLDAMLRAIGLSRNTNVYIANVLKSRPPGNRDPKPEEVAACLPYLMRQIALLQPRLILAVGRIAAQNLLSTDMPLGRLRGKVHYFGELNTPLIVTYHPAYLLRTPGDKRKAWEDLKFARSHFRQLTSHTDN